MRTKRSGQDTWASKWGEETPQIASFQNPSQPGKRSFSSFQWVSSFDSDSIQKSRFFWITAFFFFFFFLDNNIWVIFSTMVVLFLVNTVSWNTLHLNKYTALHSVESAVYYSSEATRQHLSVSSTALENKLWVRPLLTWTCSLVWTYDTLRHIKTAKNFY